MMEKEKKTNETLETSKGEGDWSLRANGDTYLDRNNESKILGNRLSNSSASVTGIAGQRGAGKSSLAIKILNEAKNRGAFTLLIHSPTGYEPRDFLISIFQRICEEVVFRINQKFDEVKSLSDLGKVEAKRLSRRQLVIRIGAIFILLVCMGYVFFQYSHERSKEINVKLKTLSGRESEVRKQLNLLKSRSNLTPKQESQLSSNTKQLEYLQRIGNRYKYVKNCFKNLEEQKFNC